MQFASTHIPVHYGLSLFLFNSSISRIHQRNISNTLINDQYAITRVLHKQLYAWLYYFIIRTINVTSMCAMGKEFAVRTFPIFSTIIW